MCQYGIPETGEWFQTAMQVCFWAYASVAVVTSASIYLIIWSTQYARLLIFAFHISSKTALTYTSQDFPDPYHDAHLDLPCVSAAPGSTVRCEPNRCPSIGGCSSSHQLAGHRSCGSVSAGHGFPRQPDGAVRLYISSHDTEDPSRDDSTWNGRPYSLCLCDVSLHSSSFVIRFLFSIFYSYRLHSSNLSIYSLMAKLTLTHLVRLCRSQRVHRGRHRASR